MRHIYTVRVATRDYVVEFATGKRASIVDLLEQLYESSDAGMQEIISTIVQRLPVENVKLNEGRNDFGDYAVTIKQLPFVG